MAEEQRTSFVVFSGYERKVESSLEIAGVTTKKDRAEAWVNSQVGDRHTAFKYEEFILDDPAIFPEAAKD